MAQTMAGSDVSAARVAAILTAAEEAAERIRLDAEAKMQARIAEGDRAAENRVRAAEEEAKEIIAAARAEADSIRAEAESKALETIARAEEEATKALDGASQRAASLLRDARAVAGEVKAEGTELTAHLRELSDSLRSNAGRLLRDILDAHAALIAELDRVDGGASATPSRRRTGTSRRQPPPTDGGDLDVPEFVPGRH
jgi:vacuolar-type H+-ATPase subunit H